MFLTMPVCLLIVLNSQFTFKINLLKILCVYISLCTIVISISLVIVIILEVPLKVAFKKILAK